MKREPGYYWVGNNVGDWNVCEWVIESCGHALWKDTRGEEYHDSDFTEIDERRIIREEQCKDNPFKGGKLHVWDKKWNHIGTISLDK